MRQVIMMIMMLMMKKYNDGDDKIRNKDDGDR